MTPTLLIDKSRLQEIYDLRVTAYENSPKSVYVNREIFPNGWFDNLDTRDETLHWIVEDNDKIIASARLALLDNIKDTNEDFDKFELPNERPFAYWSRLVVHPNYRKRNVVNMLDKVRFDFINTNQNIAFSVCCASDDRSKILTDIGFKYLGDFMFNWNGRSEQLIKAFLFTRPQNIKA